MDSFAFWSRRLPFAGKAAFRREAASGNRGPTLKQPRCKLNLRDQRRTHCLSCFAVFSKPVAPRGSPSRAAPRGSPTLALQLLLSEQCLLSSFDEPPTAQGRAQPSTVALLRPLVSLPASPDAAKFDVELRQCQRTQYQSPPPTKGLQKYIELVCAAHMLAQLCRCIQSWHKELELLP